MDQNMIFGKRLLVGPLFHMVSTVLSGSLLNWSSTLPTSLERLYLYRKKSTRTPRQCLIIIPSIISYCFYFMSRTVLGGWSVIINLWNAVNPQLVSHCDRQLASLPSLIINVTTSSSRWGINEILLLRGLYKIK